MCFVFCFFFGAVMCSVLRHLDCGVIYNSYEFLQHNSWQNTSGELISVFVEPNTQHQTRISELKKDKLLQNTSNKQQNVASKIDFWDSIIFFSQRHLYHVSTGIRRALCGHTLQTCVICSCPFKNSSRWNVLGFNLLHFYNWESF